MSSDLFPLAFSGHKLDVEQHVWDYLVLTYPELDLASEVREMDAWLWHMHNNKRAVGKKNWRRFMVNWLNRSKHQLARQTRKEADLKRELRVGMASWEM